MEEVKLYDVDNNNDKLQSILMRLDQLEEELAKRLPNAAASSGNGTGTSTRTGSRLHKSTIAAATAAAAAGVPPVVANPSPLGLFGFAIVSWLAGLVKVIGHPEALSDGLLAGVGLFIGGLAQLIAGLIQYPKNNTHSATVFTLFGAHWISQGFVYTLRSEHYFPPAYTHEAAAIYYALLCVTTFILWIPALRMNHVLNAALLTVVFVFAFDAAAAACASRWCEIIAGLLSCLAATMAFYLSALDVVNEGFGRVILPVFPHAQHKTDYDFSSLYVPKLHYHKSATAGIHV